MHGALRKIDAEQSREDIGRLELAIDRSEEGLHAGRDHPYRAVQLPDDKALGAIAGAFGKRIIGVEVADRVLNRKYNFFNGVTLSRTTNAIYINADGSSPHKVGCRQNSLALHCVSPIEECEPEMVPYYRISMAGGRDSRYRSKPAIPHPIASEAAHAEADLPNVPPGTSMSVKTTKMARCG